MLKKFFTPGTEWSLYNPLKGWTRHGLTEGEVRLIMQTLSLAERRVTWVWKVGWDEWRQLEHPECVSLGKKIPNPNTGAPPEPPPLRDDEVTAVQLAAAKERAWGREHDRAMVGIEVQVIVNGQTFRTTTDNVSEGGLKFVDRLPDWVAGYFTVILSVEDDPMELTCMLVEDQRSDKKRVAVVETDDEESHLPRYRAWVKALV